MNKSSLNPRSGNRIRSAKVVDRRNRLREELLSTAATLFVERGQNNVSVEDLIDAVGISRATFYGFFSSKSELAASILEPVFTSGIEALAATTARRPRILVRQLVEMYPRLWHQHQHALLLTSQFDESVFPFIEKQHQEFGEAMMKLLKLIEAAGLLRNGNAALTYMVLAKTGIPLLRLYHDQPDFEQVYCESMLALLVIDSAR